MIAIDPLLEGRLLWTPLLIVILKVVEAHAKDLVIYSSFHPDICTM